MYSAMLAGDLNIVHTSVGPKITISGLAQVVHFKCSYCQHTCTFETSKPFPDYERLSEINVLQAVGEQAAGLGPRKVEKFLTTLGIPYTLHRTNHAQHQHRVGQVVMTMAKESCQAALEKEVRLSMEATQKGLVHGDMVHLCCTGDQTWPTRGSGRAYSSYCGVFTVMGCFSGNIIFSALFDKMCTTCERHEKLLKRQKPTTTTAIGPRSVVGATHPQSARGPRKARALPPSSLPFPTTPRRPGLLPGYPDHICYRGATSIYGGREPSYRGSSKAQEPKGAVMAQRDIGRYCMPVGSDLEGMSCRIRYFTADEDSAMIAAMNGISPMHTDIPEDLTPVDKNSDPNHLQKHVYEEMEAEKKKWKLEVTTARTNWEKATRRASLGAEAAAPQAAVGAEAVASQAVVGAEAAASQAAVGAEAAASQAAVGAEAAASQAAVGAEAAASQAAVGDEAAASQAAVGAEVAAPQAAVGAEAAAPQAAVGAEAAASQAAVGDEGKGKKKGRTKGKGKKKEKDDGPAKWKDGPFSKSNIDYFNKMYRYVVKGVAAVEDLPAFGTVEDKIKFIQGALLNMVDHAFNRDPEHLGCKKHRNPMPDGTWQSWCGVEGGDPEYRTHLPGGKWLEGEEYYRRVRKVILANASPQQIKKQLHNFNTNAIEGWNGMFYHAYLPGGKGQQTGQGAIFHYSAANCICSKNDGQSYRQTVVSRLGIDVPFSMKGLDLEQYAIRVKAAEERRSRTHKRRRLQRKEEADKRSQYASCQDATNDSRGRSIVRNLEEEI
ncbi:hypothetical protein CYMTET_40443 [Cymbomonas tetramitiformis]|uniref:Mutator-like transposase domain-containing protein n=1 Tax=Cymbomonas tetramitiformis TaxID=36881 RepID=A0AAE0CA53_9CHLO|nr:hypothetical protein CYMTET_40443 [Cymbomonas tetramitiformis]